MNSKMKKGIFLGVMVLLLITLTACDSGSDSNSDIVYHYNGSYDEGDFISIDLNLSKNRLSYHNRITGEKGSSDFTKLSNGMYSMGPDLFLTLDDQVLIATNEDGDEGEQILTTLKEVNSPYGDEILGKYNIITSLEGARGTVDIKTDSKLDIAFENSSLRDLPDLDYSFKDEYKAIEIIEEGPDGSFRHYGVFLDGKIGVFDSYWKETPESDWQGDGMSILVREDSSIDLEDFVGEYSFIDVDADSGSFELKYVDQDSLELFISAEGRTVALDNIVLDKGMASFEAGIVDPALAESWSMMLVPGDEKIIVLGSEDDHTFGGDEGGLLIGIGQDN